MRATISLLGLYNYDNTVLDGLVIPVGLDAELLKKNLLIETAELEVLYASASFMKSAIEVWSQKMLAVWEKQWKTTQFEYNPLDSYRRLENWTDKGKGNTKGTETNNITSDDTTMNSGSAYNSAAFENREREDRNAYQNGETANSTNTENESEHSGEIRGNVGLHTPQNLIIQERNIVKYNMYNNIINDFIKRFCLLVY